MVEFTFCSKLWDQRKAASVMELKENEDFISDMTCDPENRTLLAARYVYMY